MSAQLLDVRTKLGAIARTCAAAGGTAMAGDVRDIGVAVAELIEADKEYDAARHALIGTPTDAALARLQAARDRRGSALTRVQGTADANPFQQLADHEAAIARIFRGLGRKLDADYHDGRAEIFARNAQAGAA